MLSNLGNFHQTKNGEDDGGEEHQEDYRSHTRNTNVIGRGGNGRYGRVHTRDQ
jgi:hypothetical protein